MLPQGGRYPEPRIAEAEWFLLNYASGTYNSPKLPAGDSDFQYYEGGPFTVTNTQPAIGKPALTCASVGSGTAKFDDIILERVDAAGKSLETLWKLNPDTTRGWYFREKTSAGRHAHANTGHGNNTSLSVTGMADDANPT